MKHIAAKLSLGFLCLAIAMNMIALAGCGGGGGGEGGVTSSPIPVMPSTPPEAPTALQAQDLSQTAIRLTWSDNSSNEEGFYVERKTTSTAFTRIATIPPNATSYDDTGLAQGTTYMYRVAAYLGVSTSVYSDEESATTQGQPIAADFIINHQHTGLARFNQIPGQWITEAKNTLHIAYGHSSHGNQIITGMAGLNSFTGTTMYSFNNGGTGGALDLRDKPFSGASDLGNPNRTAWEQATRTYLTANPGMNVVMWSWCKWGTQVTTATEADINTYLNLMNQLELDYPNVVFVYMTGPLDGTGEGGNLHQRNEQIRNYCRANNKVLYDYGDIERFNPDGVDFLNRMADDGCNYDSNGDGVRESNWAIEWQNSHPGEWYVCIADHTQPLNANLKAYAAWWLWARLAGWDGN